MSNIVTGKDIRVHRLLEELGLPDINNCREVQISIRPDEVVTLVATYNAAVADRDKLIETVRVFKLVEVKGQ